MPKYRVTWSEIDYYSATIEADSLEDAQRIFDERGYLADQEFVDTEFGDGPNFEEA